MASSNRRALLATLLALAATPAAALPDPADPRIRRRYLDGRFGQLHLREGHPPPGIRITAPPLVLLHQSPLSGRMYERLLPHLAERRLVLAVDTPGYGESDRPPVRQPLAAYGDAILEALRPAYGRRFDLLGYHTGAAIAANLAARQPRSVRRLVLISPPFFDEPRRLKMLAQLAEGPVPYAADGSHLLPLWTGTFRVHPPGQSLDDVARLVAEKQRVGRHGEWALTAAMAEAMGPTLTAIRVPTLVLGPHDGLEDAASRTAAAIRGARFVDMPQLGFGLFDAAPAAVAAAVLPFLDAA